MKNKINIFLKTLEGLFVGFLFLLIFLAILTLVLVLLYLIFSISIKLQVFLDVIGWVIVIFLGLYVYNSSKRDTEDNESRKQISLLESLYSELDAISSKEKEITILNKKISTQGNLQWVKELFGYGLKPAHGIWNLNTKTYITGLNRTVGDKETKLLKDALIHISQKIELISNYILQYNQIPQKVSKEYTDPIKESVLKVIDETILLVDKTKEFLKNEFKIRPNNPNP